jgi:transposase
MVYSQLLDRPSINRMEEYLQGTEILRLLELEELSSEDLYASLSDLEEIDFDRVEETLSKLFISIEKEKNSVIVDVTDTHFTGDSLDLKPRKGKEGRIKKLIQIALVVTESRGFPLFHRVYPGNTMTMTIFSDLVKDPWLRGFNSIIVDRGMISPGKLEELLEMNFVLIAGIRKSPELKRLIDTIPREEIYSKNGMIRLKNTFVYCMQIDYKGGKMIVVYNPPLESVKRPHFYENSSDKSIARYLGFSLIYHNKSLSTGEVMKKYYDKDTVKRAFKHMKGVLDLRPVRVWLESHIESHVKICYLSYATLNYLSFIMEKKGISGPEALDSLRTGYRVYLKDEKSGFMWESMVNMSDLQKKIMDVVFKRT